MTATVVCIRCRLPLTECKHPAVTTGARSQPRRSMATAGQPRDRGSDELPPLDDEAIDRLRQAIEDEEGWQR